MSRILLADSAAWVDNAPTGSRSLPQRERLICVGGLSKSQAEDLLDWLESHAYRDYHLSYIAGRGFTISYSWVDRGN